ncbi:winged helix-turn-helix transcriptional regulator [Streptomyces spiramenti]|uniref:Helix-turn-helix transcriptional regulator n=1 Tax=Streptomyces spiramenti TaxID=2720606 RepID=A0ABX1AFI1_9ACTN|nr:helix-turn-helix domain-containing protein [Streptomyces spiramenti]NJP65949.1 helix-turn-helix transcriptional regulator [Streptomyces spiramenti]
MLKHTYVGQECNLARSLEVVGERWTLLIVRSALLGTRRFEGFTEELDIARNTLNKRLRRLMEHGVLERVPYQERPPRFDYVLTPSGRDLAHAVIALTQWAEQRLPGVSAPPIDPAHRGCGGAVRVELRCAECGARLHAEDVAVGDD